MTQLQRILIAQKGGRIEGYRTCQQHPTATKNTPPAICSIVDLNTMHYAPKLMILIRLHYGLDHIEGYHAHPRQHARPGAGKCCNQ